MSMIDQTAAVTDVIHRYLAAVRSNDAGAFRDIFEPQANIVHYFVKGDELRSSTLEEFIASMAALHAKFDNAEERASEIEVRFAGPLASARVVFGFVMGARVMEGQDLFNLALCKGAWKIIHKSYFL
jgi:uncharacterized protein (TIGR02246 family)